MTEAELLVAFLRSSDTDLVDAVHEDGDGMYILFRRPEDERCAGGGTLFVPHALSEHLGRRPAQ